MYSRKWGDGLVIEFQNRHAASHYQPRDLSTIRGPEMKAQYCQLQLSDFCFQTKIDPHLLPQFMTASIPYNDHQHMDNATLCSLIKSTFVAVRFLYLTFLLTNFYSTASTSLHFQAVINLLDSKGTLRCTSSPLRYTHPEDPADSIR